MLLKVPVRCGEATAGEITKLCQGHVKHKVLFHKSDQVNFTRLFKVGQQLINIRIDCPQYADRFVDLYSRDVLREWFLHFEVRHHRSEAALQQGMVVKEADLA